MFRALAKEKCIPLTDYINSPFPCDFNSRYGTQHSLLNLFNKWQSCLDKSGKVGTILIYAFCLPHELILAKLHAYGVDMKSLETS